MARERLLIACAWMVHFYTALGAVGGLLALEYTARGAFRNAFIAMAVTIAIDSSDGALARALAVRERLPAFDGALLDNIVDYLNYVAVPAFLMLRAALLPATLLGTAAAALIMLASAYGFSQTDAKTVDHYFRGFPSYWNLVALYLFCLGLGPAANLAIVVLLALLELVPLKYIYPSRTVPLRRTTLALGLVWAVVTVAMLPALPAPNTILLYISLAYIVYYFVMSFALNARPLRRWLS